MKNQDDISILIAGDFCPYHRVDKLVKTGHSDIVFQDFQALIQGCDISVVNFESTVEEPNSTKNSKHGECFSCSEKSVELLKKVGFNVATLANNHFYDYGDSGVKKTLDCLRGNEIDYVGGGKNLLEASRVLYKKVRGKTIAFINCCENEFSIATNAHGGSNPLNPIRQYYDVQEARKNADFVILIIHGGHEHYQYPSPRMKETYRFFVDAGADAVVNGHQHCYSGYEVYNGKPIFYGIGNFCFDWEVNGLKPWHWGYMVELHFTDNQQVSFDLYPYIQCYKTPSVNKLNADQLQIFSTNLQAINTVIADDQELLKKFNSMVEKQALYYSVDFEPYNNRLLRALYTRRFLPSLIGTKKILHLYNYVICESHYDILSKVLKGKLKI